MAAVRSCSSTSPCTATHSPNRSNKLRPQFAFFGIHGAHQDELRILGGRNSVTLDRDPAVAAASSKRSTSDRQQIHLIYV